MTFIIAEKRGNNKVLPKSYYNKLGYQNLKFNFINQISNFEIRLSKYNHYEQKFNYLLESYPKTVKKKDFY